MLANTLFNNRRYFSLVLLVIVVVGLTSFRSIGRQEDPTITNFVATVKTFYPGATPDRVEALVTRIIEDELREIPEVEEISSTSSTGVSFVTVQLLDSLSDEALERGWSEIRDAVDDAAQSFPPGVSPSQIDTDIMSSYVRIVAIRSADHSEAPLTLLKRIAEDFADRSRNFTGTKLVDLFGMPEEEIRVQVDEMALAARGISFAEVAAALRAADPKVSAGRTTGTNGQFLIEVAGDFDSQERIREVIVRTTADGRAVRIADIASVYKAAVTPPRSLAFSQGHPSILVGVSMKEGLQVDRWSADFDDFMNDFRANAPAGIIIETSYDQSGYTRERLNGVAANLAIGVSLVILVLLFTLGWRAAVVVAVILPLCSLMSLTLLYYIDVPIHQMSVTGLVVALGLLVDGSIVVTDEVRKRLLDGRSAGQAITDSVSRMRVPLLSSTATTVLAFTPMVILQGPAGDFLGSIATSVVVMLGSSLVLALTVTPVLAARLLPGGLERGGHWWNLGMDSGALGQWFVRSLDWSLTHKAASIVLALALPITGFLAFPTLTAQFFPGTDRDQLYIQVSMPNGSSLENTRAIVGQMDERLRGEPLIRRVDWTVGESPPGFYYNMRRAQDGIPSYAEALVLTRDENKTDALIRRLQREFDSAYPGARTIVRGIDQGPPVDAPLEVLVLGPNLEVLRELGEQFRQRMEMVPDITHTTTSLTAGAPKVVFNLDEQRLRLAGLQLADVADTLDAALLGRTGGEILEDTERLPVRARLIEESWSDSEQILNMRLPIAAATGADRLPAVPLNTLGSFDIVPSRSPISRENGVRVNKVQGYLVRGVLPEEALKLLRQDLADNPIPLPVGYKFQFGGDSDERAGVVEDIMAPMGLILALMLATILLTFNSWRLSAVSFLVCICSLGLSLLSLALFNYPFGVQALIGVIGSIGVSINAAIIIMTALQLDKGAMTGDVIATRNVIMDSSRHIVSTTVTTFGGFLPLILEGSQFWPPFAMAIAGGVLLSTIVSFYLVPPLFLLVSRKTPEALATSEPAEPTITANNVKKLHHA
ncbi:efflux RND transporter permease subunit [Halioglobus pacificus]|uniref:Acriflavin resistance protein n=1 Tax=Parahalioglobus pacificus TaxID=930806 RepID=A0A918XGJ4_9GAMM|nr:efflux RND transporter permease subunit [Halioglobus pacificus]GHD30300.1 acriflavin resistance protein [Halioglobus pacificus]